MSMRANLSVGKHAADATAGGTLTLGQRLFAAKEARAALVLLRFEVAAAGFGVLFVAAALAVCALLSQRGYRQRLHNQQIAEAKVGSTAR